MCNDNIVFVIPETEDSFLNTSLRKITEILLEVHGHEWRGGALGGKYGYGVDFENDIFMMHGYCWCEKEDCNWCVACHCTFIYFIDGEQADWQTYYDTKAAIQEKYRCAQKDRACFKQGVEYQSFKERHPEAYKETIERTYYKANDPICKRCETKNFVALPNFHHKESDFKVWWYKWIGRDFEYSNPNEVDIEKVMKECIENLRNDG